MLELCIKHFLLLCAISGTSGLARFVVSGVLLLLGWGVTRGLVQVGNGWDLLGGDVSLVAALWGCLFGSFGGFGVGRSGVYGDLDSWVSRYRGRLWGRLGWFYWIDNDGLNSNRLHIDRLPGTRWWCLLGTWHHLRIDLAGGCAACWLGGLGVGLIRLCRLRDRIGRPLLGLLWGCLRRREHY